MTKRLPRRIFLRGLGGACVAAPFLGSVGDRSARAQAPPAPKRLIVMFTHYGCLTTRFFPAKSHGALSASDLEPTTLKPLAPYVDKLLLPRGVRAMNEWTPDLSRGQGNDIHYHVGSFFTCQPLSPNSDTPFSFDTSTLFAPKPVGPSLDHVMAQQVSPSGAPLLVRVGNVSDSPQSAISYSAASTSYPGLGAATQIFSGLTGLFVDGPLSPDGYQAMRGKSVIDIVRDDLDTLERVDMSQSDRNKLEAWKTLLDETGHTLSAECSHDGAALLDATQANVDAVKSSVGTDALTTKIAGDRDGADIYSSLAVLGALCNMNPVIFLKYPPSYVYRGLGLTLDHHSISHRIGNAGLTGTCVASALEQIHTVDRYHASKFAHLVELLSSVDEGDGKLLDNTAAVWFQEQSDGLAHNLNNLPIVQVGSLGGYFKTGAAVNLDGGSPTLTSGLSELLCADGALSTVSAIGETGTDPALANAPINKYFCTLMNALGVKAGADGFPLVGGPEKVRCFGMYDRTEDFIGGGTVPPQIHDPGEFDALRASS